ASAPTYSAPAGTRTAPPPLHPPREAQEAHSCSSAARGASSGGDPLSLRLAQTTALCGGVDTPPHSAPAGTRTQTEAILSRLPLPIGLRGRAGAKRKGPVGLFRDASATGATLTRSHDITRA